MDFGLDFSPVSSSSGKLREIPEDRLMQCPYFFFFAPLNYLTNSNCTVFSVASLVCLLASSSSSSWASTDDA